MEINPGPPLNDQSVTRAHHNCSVCTGGKYLLSAPFIQIILHQKDLVCLSSHLLLISRINLGGVDCPGPLGLCWMGLGAAWGGVPAMGQVWGQGQGLEQPGEVSLSGDRFGDSLEQPGQGR